MRTRILIAAALLSLAFAPAPLPRNTAEEELKHLQGTWGLVSLDRGGISSGMAKERAIKAIIAKDRWTFRVKDKFDRAGYKMVVNPASKPKTLDLIRPGSKTPTIRAIYFLDGEVLKICYGRRGERPKAIGNGKDPDVLVMTLHREKR
jgi:uncharacterized protein (TIGR03067 family)